MSNNSTETQRSVIAILKTDNKLKAVELFKQNGSSKILWAKSSIDNDLDWQAFATRCGLSSTFIPQEQVSVDKNVVVGYDSKGTAFYLLNLPAVDEKELSTIVHLQAESRLPLPADQMQLAWRTSKLGNKQMAITIAAARKQQVQKFIEKVKFLRPVRAILDSECIVNVWKELFSGQTSASSVELEQNTVIVNAGTHNTQICLAKNGLLCDAVTLDLGTIDFGESESQEETETIDRLIQDTRSVMDLFGVEKHVETPVIILSDDSKIYEILAASLKSAGLNARLATPSIKKLKSDNQLDLKEIFEYRAPIGLALMALDGEADELNLFAHLFKPAVRNLKKHWYYSPQITGAIAAVMLLLLAAVSYALIVAGSTEINKKLSNIGSETEINALVEKQKFLNEVASQRADLLLLIADITKSGQSNTNAMNSQRGLAARNTNPQPGPSGPGGIQLESFHFKKRQRVTITGLAQNKEQLENFEKSLSSNKDIKDVHLTSKPNTGSTGARNQGSSRGSGNISRGNPQPQPMGQGGPGSPGNKGFTFTITFNYKNFTAVKTK